MEPGRCCPSPAVIAAAKQSRWHQQPLDSRCLQAGLCSPPLLSQSPSVLREAGDTPGRAQSSRMCSLPDQIWYPRVLPGL